MTASELPPIHEWNALIAQRCEWHNVGPNPLYMKCAWTGTDLTKVAIMTPKLRPALFS